MNDERGMMTDELKTFIVHRSSFIVHRLRPSMRARLLIAFMIVLLAAPCVYAEEPLFARDNLVAWCIVPFDAKKRGPEERAAMLERLGFKLFAYDYRAEHISSFDAEMDALERHRIRLLAWWFPPTMNDEARLILDVLKRHRLKHSSG